MLTDARNFMREWYRRLAARNEDVRAREVIDVLRRVPMFQRFPRHALIDLADVLHVRTYRRDEFLYYERDPGLGMYIVQRGRVRLLVEDEEGMPSELRQVDEFEVFGLHSLLGDFRRLESAQAATEVRVLGFFRPDLKTILKRHPRSGALVVATLARSLVAAQAELVNLIADKDGLVSARRMLHQAVVRARPHETDLPPGLS